MEKGFFSFAGRRLVSGPRPKPAWPASLPAARFSLASSASPAQAQAAAAPARSRARLPRLPSHHAAPVHRRRGAVPAPTSRAPPSKRSERAHATPLHHSTSPASLPLAPQQQQPRPSCRARRSAPPTLSSRTTAPSHDSRRP